MIVFEENYYYQVYYESSLLRDSSDLDEYFEDYEEAIDEANEFIEDRIEQWKIDGAEYTDDDRENFSIEICETEREVENYE